jgi:hypothetical protein
MQTNRRKGREERKKEGREKNKQQENRSALPWGVRNSYE